MKRAISFVLLIVLGVASFSQNLVVNPGFESWETTTKPSGWSTAQNCLKDEININSGSSACQHSGGTTSKWLGQTITILPGKQYHFSFFYRTVITANGNGCRIWSNWIDAENVDINDPSTKPILQSTTNYLKSDLWKQYSVDITSPANAKYFYLEVRTYPNCVTYWDDFVFEESVATSNPEESSSQVNIYPNPTHDYLNISNIQNIQHIDIQSLTGRILWSSSFHGEEKVVINVSGLPEGIYIISIETKEKTTIRKFIRR